MKTNEKNNLIEYVQVRYPLSYIHIVPKPNRNRTVPYIHMFADLNLHRDCVFYCVAYEAEQFSLLAIISLLSLHNQPFGELAMTGWLFMFFCYTYLLCEWYKCFVFALKPYFDIILWLSFFFLNCLLQYSHSRPSMGVFYCFCAVIWFDLTLFFAGIFDKAVYFDGGVINISNRNEPKFDMM